MKKLTQALLATGVIYSSMAAQAQEGPVSANVAITSEYLYRGVSQTSGSTALQGGFDYDSETGFYLGAWASTITFDDSVEIDYYGGYSGSLTEELGYDLGFIYYDYPGMSSDDYLEFYGALSYGGLSASINYSDDFFAGSGKTWYYTLGYGFDLGNDFALDLHYGLQTYDQDAWGGEDSYSEYNISLSKNYAGLDFAVMFSDTDLSTTNCGGSSDCDSTVVVSVGKSF